MVYKSKENAQMKLKEDEVVLAEVSMIIPAGHIEKREGKLAIILPLDRKLVVDFYPEKTNGAMYAVIPDGGHINIKISKR